MILALALTMALNASASSADTDNQPVTETLSQLIRSNATHYWSWVKKPMLAPYSSVEGIVAGDPHMGNFSVVPVETAGGVRTLRFVDIDLDDAGQGSLALDFTRYVVTVKVVDKDIKIKDLVDAYVAGLNGVKSKAPDRVQEGLDMTMADYDALNDKYVDHKTSHGKFKLGDDLVQYRAKYSMSDIAKLFPHDKVLDVATRPVDRGGSASAVRIWVLTEDAKGTQSINEIKGYEPTAMLKFEPQQAPAALVKKVQAAFWPGLNPSFYDLTTIAGDLVWVRAKKIALFDVSYKDKSTSDNIFRGKLAIYDANHLGLIHGSQSKAYAALISKDPDAFREAMKQVAHDYIDYAEKTLR